MTAKTESRVDIKIPFDGFYNTTHEHTMNSAFENINETNGSLELQDIEWAKVRLAYAQDWLQGIVKQTGLDLQFKKIHVPADFSQGNDQLIGTIPLAAIEKMHADMTKAEITEWKALVKEELTERPGFAPWSKYSTNADDWGPVTLWDEAQRDLFIDFRLSPCIDETVLHNRINEIIDDIIMRAVDPEKIPNHADNSSDPDL